MVEPGRSWHKDLKENRNCIVETRCVWRSSKETLNFTETPRMVQSGISDFVKPRRKVRGTTYGVETISLNDLLAEHAAPPVIDFMSVDTEGSELEILKAFDFSTWSCRVLTVEHNHKPAQAEINALLTGHGYRQVAPDLSRFDDWYVKDI